MVPKSIRMWVESRKFRVKMDFYAFIVLLGVSKSLDQKPVQIPYAKL